MNKIINIKDIQNITRNILSDVDFICKENNIPYSLVCGSVLGAIRHGGPIPWDHDVDICVPYYMMNNFIKAMDKLSNPYYIATRETESNYAVGFPRIGVKGIDTRNIHVDIFPSIGITDNYKDQKKFHKDIIKIRKLYFYKCKSTTNDGTLIKRIKKRLLWVVLLPITEDSLRKKLDEFCSRYPYETSDFVTNPYGGYGMKNILPKEFFVNLIRVKYMDLQLPIISRYDDYLKHYYNNYMKLPSLEEQTKNIHMTMEIPENIWETLGI